MRILFCLLISVFAKNAFASNISHFILYFHCQLDVSTQTSSTIHNLAMMATFFRRQFSALKIALYTAAQSKTSTLRSVRLPPPLVVRTSRHAVEAKQPRPSRRQCRRRRRACLLVPLHRESSVYFTSAISLERWVRVVKELNVDCFCFMRG